MEKLASGRTDRLIYPPLPGSALQTAPPSPSVAAVALPPSPPVVAVAPPHSPPVAAVAPPSSPSIAAVAPPPSPSVAAVATPPRPSVVAPSSPLSLPKPQVLVGTKPSGLQLPVTVPPVGRSSPTLTSEKTAGALNHRGHSQPPAAHGFSSKAPPPQPPASPAPSDPSKEQVALAKVRDLLVKYSHGLWAPALPKLFSDTYKVPLPQNLLDDLSLLMDFCRVDYPMAHNKNKVRNTLQDQDDQVSLTAPKHTSQPETFSFLPHHFLFFSLLSYYLGVIYR